MKNTDIISLAIDYLNKKYKTTLETEYYSRIQTWREWWEGYVEEVHSYKEMGADKKPRKRKLYRLGMAKRVCEDWASLLLNEKTQLAIEHEPSRLFLQGENGTGGVLGYNDFWSEGNELLEKVFAFGTGAFIARAEGAKVNDNGSIIPDSECKVGIEYVDAMSIIPLSVKKSKITECAFVSTFTKHGKECCYIETHTIGENGNYIIENSHFIIDGLKLKEQELPDGIAQRIDTGSSAPWFSIVYPNVSNNIRCNNGLGLSVYANALDALAGVDMYYNNFLKDVKLGGKKVFYNKNMLLTDEEGHILTPDDMAQSLFQQVGDGEDFDSKAMVQEYNPDLRVTENKEGVQSALNYLSFSCGMGAHRYKFEAAGVKTATEYTGERQELVQHANKHIIVLESALLTLCKAILYIGKTFCGADCDPDTLITVNFEDGFVIDEETRREQFRQDVRDGLRAPWEYRVEFYGETPEDAQAKIKELKTTTGNPFGFMG